MEVVYIATYKKDNGYINTVQFADFNEMVEYLETYRDCKVIITTIYI
jgi:hypothetical protein